MKGLRISSLILAILLTLASAAGCGDRSQTTASRTPVSTGVNVSEQPAGSVPVYKDPNAPIEDRVEDLLSRMNPDEKVGQMIQAINVSFGDAAKYCIGSILSGGSDAPGDKSIAAWDGQLIGYQKAAASTRLGIPIIYGVDAVHGMAKFANAVVFPHNSGLGAANDPSLMEKIGEYTAKEMLLCNVTWNFAPCVAVAKDIRWGRTYESYSENADRVTSLAIPYISGLQKNGAVACAKHFFGDGGTKFGTGSSGYLIDQGDFVAKDSRVIDEFLAPYKAAIESGVRTIMVSFSSLNGIKMHENGEWVQKWLKDEMGFTGFVVSDYEGIQQLKPAGYHQQIVRAVNAGIDMLMEPTKWKQAIAELKAAVQAGEISTDRLDDAVRRILRVKFEDGLFDTALGYSSTGDATLSEAKQVARRAVRESLVLLKNENRILPLKKNANLLVLGKTADDTATLCGGWTINWQGLQPGEKQSYITGTTILDGFKEIAEQNGGHIYTDIKDAPNADAVILVLGERPHAEGRGDDGNLTLYGGLGDINNQDAVEQARATGLPIITILVSGRPRIITQEIQDWSAFVMAWLPGSEAAGVADVLYGDDNFTGTLPFTWPKSINYFTKEGPFDRNEVLFKYGDGLTY